VGHAFARVIARFLAFHVIDQPCSPGGIFVSPGSGSGERLPTESKCFMHLGGAILSKKIWGLLAAISILVGLLPLVASATHQDDTVEQTQGAPENQPGYWVNYLETVRGIEDASCTKIDESGSSAFVMPAEPEGRDWVLLVVKQATTNYVFYDPIAGESYESHQGGGGFSHLIVCSVEEPEFVPEGDLVVTKTAELTYSLSHKWDIDKNADQTSVQLLEGESATVTWQIDVDYLGADVTDAVVSGDITLDNLGSNVAARITSIEDNLDTGEVGVVDCPDDLPFDIPAGGSVTCTYEADLADPADGTNTVEVEGVFASDEASTMFDGEAIAESDDAAFTDNGPASETYASVNVDDVSDYIGIGNQSFGPVNAPDGASFTYSETFTFEGVGECATLTIDNTATIRETGQSDDETVVIETECFVFEGETATGDGLAWSDVGSGKKKVNTWFEYSPFAESDGDIITGAKKTDIGDFTYTDVGSTAELCFDLDDPWVFAGVAGNVKIQPLSSQPTSYLAPGSFTYHFELDGSEGCVTVPDATYGYAIHLDVGQWVSVGFPSDS
jgi:hypothetical protein